MQKNKNNVKVIIDNKVYNLTSMESEDYILSIASYINEKLEQLNKSAANTVNTASLNTSSVIAAINIADDLFKEREKNKKNMETVPAFEEELNAAKSEIEKIKKDNLTLQEKIKSLSYDINNFKNKSNEAEALSRNYKNETKLSKSENTALKMKINALTNEINEMKRNENSKINKDKTNSELNKIKYELETSKKNEFESKSKLEKIKNELLDVKDELKQTRRELYDYKKLKFESDKQIDIYKQNSVNLSKQLKDVKDEYENKIKKLNLELENYKKELNDFINEFDK